jgi:hypothetical protein
MPVSMLMGLGRMPAAYAHAIENGYCFLFLWQCFAIAAVARSIGRLRSGFPVAGQ